MARKQKFDVFGWDEICEFFGKHRNTLHYWRVNDPKFAAIIHNIDARKVAARLSDLERYRDRHLKLSFSASK